MSTCDVFGHRKTTNTTPRYSLPPGGPDFNLDGLNSEVSGWGLITAQFVLPNASSRK